MKRIVTIQLLRALACLLVLLHHLCNLNPLTGYRLNGAIGVDIFFVISGFIIAASVERLPPQNAPQHFAINRVSRVVPYYWLMTIVNMLVPWILVGFLPSIVELGKSGLFIPMGYDPVLGAGWSLNHELLFYGFVAVSLFFTRNMRYIALSFFAAWVLMQFLPSVRPFAREARASLNIEFLFGILIYQFRDKLHFLRSWAWLGVATVLLLGVMTSTIDAPLFKGMAAIDPPGGYFRDTVFPYYAHITLPRGLFYGIPAALFFAAFVAQEHRFQHFSDNNLLLRLGNASFSVYLIQTPCISIINYFHLTRVLLLPICFLSIILLAFSLVPIENLVARLAKRLLSAPTFKPASV